MQECERYKVLTNELLSILCFMFGILAGRGLMDVGLEHSRSYLAFKIRNSLFCGIPRSKHVSVHWKRVLRIHGNSISCRKPECLWLPYTVSDLSETSLTTLILNTVSKKNLVFNFKSPLSFLWVCFIFGWFTNTYYLLKSFFVVIRSGTGEPWISHSYQGERIF